MDFANTVAFLGQALSWLEGALPWLVPSAAGFWAVYRWSNEHRRAREQRISELTLNNRIEMYMDLKRFLQKNMIITHSEFGNTVPSLDSIYIDFLLYANENELNKLTKMYKKWKELIERTRGFEARQEESELQGIGDSSTRLALIERLQQDKGELLVLANELDNILYELFIAVRMDVRQELNMQNFEVEEILLPKLAERARNLQRY